MLRIPRLQRKVLLVIVLIILLPMLITGSLSASWISKRVNKSIAQRLHESARLDNDTFRRLYKNARLFADILLDTNNGRLIVEAGQTPVPAVLNPLAKELGISLVQVYAANGDQLYSTPHVRLLTALSSDQSGAVISVGQDGLKLLASITVVHAPDQHGRINRLVLGTLFDQALLAKLSRDSGLTTRLYYPHDGDFINAFSDDGPSLKQQLPAPAFARLLHQQDYFSANAEQGRYWALYSPVLDASGQVEAVLFSGQQRVGSARLLSDQGLLTLVIFVAGVILSVATGLLLGRVVLRPVNRLHQGVLRVAAQDFRTSLPVRSQDELGELAQAFNAMAESLHQARDEQHRAFQRDKLAALGELAMAMAHEIRNPIGTITTASGLLQTTEDNAKQARLREAIHDASQRLDQLLNDFQQLARHQPPHLLALDPAAPLERILTQMLAGRDEIKLVRHYCHGEEKVRGDSNLLQQAWANLVRNALEAMGEQAGRLEVGSVVDAETDTVLIYLQDSGPGIPLAQVTRLFEPFYTSKAKGSGLGLTIAASLVEANGAHLEFVPGAWRGARFAMRFPRLDTEDD